jgi:hypothetical protein
MSIWPFSTIEGLKWKIERLEKDNRKYRALAFKYFLASPIRPT